ncbi:MAG: hypothetical protein AMXMBFR12_02830 [Candidatus Babeliales bacterium]
MFLRKRLMVDKLILLLSNINYNMVYLKKENNESISYLSKTFVFGICNDASIVTNGSSTVCVSA